MFKAFLLTILICDATHCYHSTAENECEFGMYTSDGANSSVIINQNCKLISTLNELNALQNEFISYFNQYGGIYAIDLFHTSDCCFTFGNKKEYVAINDKYIIPAIKEKDRFDQNQTDMWQCNPMIGYTMNQTYFFYFSQTGHYVHYLSESNVTFGISKGCDTSVNPSIYYRYC